MKIQILNSNYFPNISRKNNDSLVSNVIGQENSIEYAKASTLNFQAQSVMQKTISSKIAHDKTRLIRNLTEILSTNIPLKTNEEVFDAFLKRAHSVMLMKKRRVDELKREIDLLTTTKLLNNQQKQNRFHEIKKELNALSKNKAKDFFTIPKVPKEDYDFLLINKFKNALLNEDFNLKAVFLAHYKDLENIETLEELKAKYPQMKLPKTPGEVLAQKITEILPREFYIELNRLLKSSDVEESAHFLEFQLFLILNQVGKELGLDTRMLMEKYGIEISRKILEIHSRGANEVGNFNFIPLNRKNTMIITGIDKAMLELDYDKFVIHTLKEHYLYGKKFSEIEYIEGDSIARVADLKGSDYKFEKLSEKVKKIIADAEKIKLNLREYNRYVEQDFRNRLNYYAGSEIGNDSRIFDLIFNFATCRFTKEDTPYLIKFLQELDKVKDGELTIETAVDKITKQNLYPHGTKKLKDIEEETSLENLKRELQQSLMLNNLKEEFNNAINLLYEYDLASLAEICSKYLPQNLEENTVSNTKKLISMINRINSENKKQIKTQILRWDIYNEYMTSEPQSSVLANAYLYARGFEQEDLEQRVGQYLYNAQIVEMGEESIKLYPEKEILARILDKFNSRPEIATLMLCKYEDYKNLDPESKKSILKISEIFDVKNADDRVILKTIIENDYINTDTSLYFVPKGNKNERIKTTMASEAKYQIIDKYKYPTCLDFFIAFENALTQEATARGKAGVKKIGKNKDGKIDYTAELKIMGDDDRLFATGEDYYFNIHSDKGLH